MKLFLIFILITTSQFSLYSQKDNNQEAPKLVLFIHVDELQTEHLLAYKNKFSPFGFNQLINKGTFYHKGNYETTTPFVGTKFLNMYSGCHANTHGIISDMWYPVNQENSEQAYTFSASNEINYPDSGVIIAPNIHASTLTDELHIISRGQSKIASVALSPDNMAFFAHPQKSNMYWFDRTKGNMISQADTSISEWIDEFNSKKFADLYIGRQWGPITDLKKYHEYITLNKVTPRHFLYDLKSDKENIPYKNLIGSPYGNTILRDFVASLMLNENYGKDEFTDFLSVSFTCKPFMKDKQELFDAEVEDMILRLDDQLESLINVVKDNIGLERTLIVLTSTPSTRWLPETLKKEQINTGYFNGKKTAALLNLYLMAIYGQGKWIKGYHDKQFYFNHKLLEKEKISLNEIEEKSAKFLLEVSGISKTITAYHLRVNEYTTGEFHEFQQNYFFGRSGDLFVSLKPGWTEEINGSKTNHYDQGLYSPLIFFGWNRNAIQIFESIKMIDLAPTISSIVGMPNPNGCVGEPLKEVVEQ